MGTPHLVVLKQPDTHHNQPECGIPTFVSHTHLTQPLLVNIRFPVYSLGVEWEIEATDEFFAWADALERSDDAARDMLDAVIDMLAEKGPAMRRPYVGEIVTSRHHNMKELRVPASNVELRVLFCFDPRRMAILLLGGDKSKDSMWNAWYEKAVPEADDLYDTYLEELREEGLLP
jgi:hypothetical protein